MLNPYRMLQEKMERFNAWERGYHRAVSVEKRLDHFRILFETKDSLPPEVIQRANREHLDSLIEIQKRMKGWKC